MICRIYVLLVVFWLTEVLGVNRDNFKSCKQSSFCSRQRGFTSESHQYYIEENSVVIGNAGVTAVLKKRPGNQTLSLQATYLAFSTFRIVIDENTPGSRYRLKPGDSLKSEPKPYPLTVFKSENALTLSGSRADKAVISLDPFSVDFFVDDVLVSSLNRRNLLNFEDPSDISKPTETRDTTVDQGEQLNPPEQNPETEDVRADSVADGSHLESPAGTDGNEKASEDDVPAKNEVPSNSAEESVTFPGKDKGAQESEPKLASTAQSGTETEPDSHPESESEATPSTEPAVEPEPSAPARDPHPWSEHFKEHLDTRPRGPSSLSLDIDFPGFLHAYGIPEHADSLVLKDTSGGDPYRLYNLDVFEYELNNPMALYGSVPFLWALNANYTVGLFWHNPSETWIDVEYSERPTDSFLSKIPRLFKSAERYVRTKWISESGVIDAFVMLGRSPSDVSRAYMHLTGSTPLPPLFALAYHQCRWNYNDEADVISLDQHFDEYRIPMDVIWLDIEHTDGKRYLTWDHSKFPNPGEMVDKLDIKGRKLVTVVDPHIKRDGNWQLYRDASDKGYFVKSRDGGVFDGWCWPGSSSWPDFINPTVRRWWSEQFLSYNPVRTNTMYTWNDMGEPSVFNGPEVTMYKDNIHDGGWEHRDVHNIYGLLVHAATWEGQLLRSNHRERPFVLTRAFFAGSQRTAAVWTGDNTANWDHLEMSIPMVLSLSITGLTLAGADVGGFFGNPDPELLTRWYQAAAFQPFFRAHAHLDTKRREPWLLPETNLRIVREAIAERYKMLPYWYTVFARAEADGQPVMAPMWYHYRDLSETYDMQHQYTIGKDVLVCPVTSAGARKVDVFFPPGVWYSFPSLKMFSGNKVTQVPVDLSSIPVFYRGGAIIPRRERLRRSSWLMRNDPFTLIVCLNPASHEAHGYIYVDDYHSISRQSARFFRVQYDADADSKTVGGGRLRLVRLPVPGTTVLPENDPPSNTPSIERIVFVGLTVRLERVTVLEKQGTRRNVAFIHSAQPGTADAHYFAENKSGVVVIRQPSLPLNSMWELHLVTGNELKSEL